MGTFKEGIKNRKTSISQPGRPSQGGAGGYVVSMSFDESVAILAQVRRRIGSNGPERWAPCVPFL